VIFARGPTDNSLLQYAYQRGWDGVRVLSDADVLLRAIRAGRVEVVLANSLSGMARSVPELVAALRELVSRGGALIIPGRGINTSEAPQVFIEIFACIEEFMHRVAQEATEEGLSKARRRGVRLGRPKIAHRYREDVAKLRARGLSGRAISQVLGLSSSSVFRIIGGLV
jgi:DNA invertase Pin-like site-specific DNA recombinase